MDGRDRVVLTPGPAFDSGTIVSRDIVLNESTPPLTFVDMGQDATLTLLSGGAGVRDDLLEYRGTDRADALAVGAGGKIDLARKSPSWPPA